MISSPNGHTKPLPPLRFEAGPADKIGKRQYKCFDRGTDKLIYIDKIDPDSAKERERLAVAIKRLWKNRPEQFRDCELAWLDPVIANAAGDADKAIEDESAPRDLERLSARELAEGDYSQPYIVESLVPQAQGGMLAGLDKTFKSTQACEILISAATGTPAFGHFRVPEAVRCGFISAELQKPGLKSLGQRVARSKGYELADIDNLVFSTSIPRVGRPDGITKLERFIANDALGICVIDPAYLSFCDVGDSASNVFKMGAALLPISELIERTGCTIILCHHNRKSRAHQRSEFAPPDRSEMSMSGFAEWMRFWILVGPRQSFNEDTGQAWQWLRTGGSAGHSGLFTLDITEGKPTDLGGRKWTYVLERASVNKQNAEAAKAKAIEDKQEEQLKADQRKIIDVMQQLKRPESKTDIRGRTHLNSVRFNIALAQLETDGHVEQIDFVKNKKTQSGWQLKPDEQPAGLTGTDHRD